MDVTWDNCIATQLAYTKNCLTRMPNRFVNAYTILEKMDVAKGISYTDRDFFRSFVMAYRSMPSPSFDTLAKGITTLLQNPGSYSVVSDIIEGYVADTFKTEWPPTGEDAVYSLEWHNFLEFQTMKAEERSAIFDLIRAVSEEDPDRIRIPTVSYLAAKAGIPLPLAKMYLYEYIDEECEVLALKELERKCLAVKEQAQELLAQAQDDGSDSDETICERPYPFNPGFLAPRPSASATAAVAAPYWTNYTSLWPENPVGTLFRWNSGDAKRTAVVTKDGVLQVKDSNSNAKIHFADLGAWLSTLPNPAVPNQDTLNRVPPSPTIAATRIAMPFPTGSAVEVIHELEKRWGVEVTCRMSPSMNDQLDSYKAALAKINPAHKSPTIRERSHMLRRFIRRLEGYMCGQTEEENAKSLPSSHSKKNTLLYFTKNGISMRAYTYKDKVVSRYTMAKTFEELGVDMKDGKPIIQVWYRGKILGLNA